MNPGYPKEGQKNKGLKPAAFRRIQSSGLDISVRLGAAGFHPPTSPYWWAKVTQRPPGEQYLLSDDTLATQ